MFHRLLFLTLAAAHTVPEDRHALSVEEEEAPTGGGAPPEDEPVRWEGPTKTIEVELPLNPCVVERKVGKKTVRVELETDEAPKPTDVVIAPQGAKVKQHLVVPDRGDDE